VDRRRIFVDLQPEDFGKLARLALRNERRPEQEAAYLIRQRLARVVEPARDRELVVAGGAEHRPEPGEGR
jgi:hypothetical protein